MSATKSNHRARPGRPPASDALSDTLVERVAAVVDQLRVIARREASTELRRRAIMTAEVAHAPLDAVRRGDDDALAQGARWAAGVTDRRSTWLSTLCRNDKGTAVLVKAVILAASYIFGTDKVDVDVSVSDAKRLCPAFGTVKRKGVDDPERPHRKTWFSVSRGGASPRARGPRWPVRFAHEPSDARPGQGGREGPRHQAHGAGALQVDQRSADNHGVRRTGCHRPVQRGDVFIVEDAFCSSSSCWPLQYTRHVQT